MNLEAFHILNPSIRDHTLTLTLDHGHVNEMGKRELEAWEALVQYLNQGEIRALITQSTKKSKRGTPIFIAGANVKERQNWSEQEVRSHVRWQRNILHALRHCPVFHICIVSGIALGWGTEFLLTSDYRLCTPEASFGLPETGLGIIPGAGGTSDLWVEIGIPQALRLGMTGERIKASEACRINLCQEMCETAEDALNRAHQLASLVCKNSPTAVAGFKSALLACVGRGANLRRGLEARAYEHCVNSKEASIGRKYFGKDIPTPWGPRQPFKP